MSRDRLHKFATIGTLALALWAGQHRCGAAETEPPAEVIISVADQKMAVLREGGVVTKFKVSTSQFGTGDCGGSYKTPLGRLRVCDKVGDNLPLGTVIKHRQATNEVLAANAPGRDPIVTRILWLEGCESQNCNAKNRSIYIHGTPEERRLGKPVSWGCVRMSSEDVINLYSMLPVGSTVTIVPEKLPRLARYVPHPVTETMVAANAKQAVSAPAKAATITPAPVAAPAPIASVETASAPHPARKAVTEPLVVASAPAPRKAASEIASVASISANSAHNHALLHDSMLTAGLNDGNSEIPQLRR